MIAQALEKISSQPTADEEIVLQEPKEKLAAIVFIQEADAYEATLVETEEKMMTAFYLLKFSEIWRSKMPESAMYRDYSE